MSLGRAKRLVLESLLPPRTGSAASGEGPVRGGPSVMEVVPTARAAGRVLAASVLAAEDVPGFDRSTVDGYAVRAADTFGAGESAPCLLFEAGQVPMGQQAGLAVGPGQAVSVPTGGMLPAGADAVVMIEHAVTPGSGLVEVSRPAAPGENVVRTGEDVGRGTEVLPAGRRLTPADLGVLAAVGVREVACRRSPLVVVIPTGDEIIPAASPFCGVGQVRDITSVALAALIGRDGGEVRVTDIVPDRKEALAEAVSSALGTGGAAGDRPADLVLILGGSSVGARDHTAAVIAELGPPGVLFHGLALKPGKPTIYGLCGPRRAPVFGLPGHPVSGLVVYSLLARLALRIVGGETLPAWEAASLEETAQPALTARLATAVSSDQGRDEYLCVHLFWSKDASAGGLLAEPVPGKSGLITMLARADGLVHIPVGRRGLEAGALVEVIPLA